MSRKPFDPADASGGLFDPAPARGAAPSEPAPLSVAQAAALVRDTMGSLGRVRIEGEIGSVSMRSTCFFTLKDPQADAVIEALMWASSLARSQAKPVAGKRMVVEGRFDFWPAGGRLRLVAERVSVVGEGDLEARFRALCEELRALGHFAMERKRPLPKLPRGVAIITAPGSAALADCLKISGSRFPSIPIIVVHVGVQGAGAADEVARAIDAVNRAAPRLGIDVVVVTRGGGSREDLQPFNERVVADAAFRSRLPLVAAIGHESDTSVIELVADVRASTPTQAMVLVFPDRAELRAQVDWIASRLALQARQIVASRRERLRQVGRRPCLRDPRGALAAPGERLARNALRLRHALAEIRAAARARLQSVEAALAVHAPRQMVAMGRLRVSGDRRRLALAARRAIEKRAERVRSLAARLEAVAPERTLARGYSITLDDRGNPVRDAAGVAEGAVLLTRLERGQVRSRVERGR